MAFVIAASKIWDLQLLERLKQKLGVKVELISDKEQLTVEKLSSLKAEMVFFPHWSHIIPKEVYESFDCVIFHMTDLPYGRGGSPLQNLIVRGHKETQVSALKCVAGLDAGPIYMKRPLSLQGKASEIYLRATQIVEEMILEIVTKKPVPVEQVGEVVEFKRRKPEQSDLSTLSTLAETYDYIRMLDAEGYPAAFLEVNGIRYEFKSVQWNGDELEASVRILKK